MKDGSCKNSLCKVHYQYQQPKKVLITYNESVIPPKGCSCGQTSTFAYSTQCSGIRGVCAMVHKGKLTCEINNNKLLINTCSLKKVPDRKQASPEKMIESTIVPYPFVNHTWLTPAPFSSLLIIRNKIQKL